MKLILLLLNAAKLGKAALTGGTMLLSMFAYALVFGWPYAVGLVLLIFCHEMGHFMAAKQRGLNVSAPAFIPFVGAWINLKDMPMNVETEAYVALAGPIIGTVAALFCYYAAQYFDSKLLLALAYAGFMINLFNLIPLSPLDGGRITSIISPKFWWVGAPILVLLFIWTQSPMLLLVALLAIPHLMATFKSEEMSKDYYNAPLRARVQYALYYFGLAIFLGMMTYQVHLALADFRVS